MLGLSDLPGEIPGVGPVAASLIREMAAEARLRWLTGNAEDGRLLDYGVNTYREPTAMAAEINATRVASVGPHSTVPATRCDIDHIVRHPRRTDVRRQLCPTRPPHPHPQDLRRAHTHPTTRRPDGLLEWTTPLGQNLTIQPWDYRLGP